MTPSTGFAINTDERGGSTVVHLEGELDVATAPSLRSELGRLIDQGHNDLILDLARLEFTDSSGLGVMVSAMKQARQQGGNLRLEAPTDRVRRVLEVTGLDKVLVVG